MKVENRRPNRDHFIEHPEYRTMHFKRVSLLAGSGNKSDTALIMWSCQAAPDKPWNLN